MACATLKRSYEFDPLLSPSFQPTAKRRRCIPISPSSTAKSPAKDSPFTQVTPKLSTEKLASSIHLEWKRLQRRRHLLASNSCTPDASPSSPPSVHMHPAFMPSNTSLCVPSANSPGTKRDQPLFSLRQVTMICERMLKERDEQLKEEYDKVLNQKLGEQYDAFVKFNYDQLQRRFGETPLSYVS